MKRTKQSGKTHWLRNTIIVLLICGVAGMILAAVQFTRHPDRTSASAALQFSFDGAAEGNSPDGNPFTVAALSSDEVLEAALKASGMGDKYTADQLRENLVVAGSYPENLVEQVMSYESLMSFTANRELTVTEYHPTLFTVTLYNDFDSGISGADLEGLLANILTAFRAYFANNYALGLDWLDDAIYDLENYDYPQQLEVIQEVIAQQARYAQQMYEEQPTFRVNGQGFNDIYVRMNNLIDSDIARLNAGITINALTRNTARLMTQYQFEIRDLTNQQEKKKTQLERMDKLIESYDKNEIIYLSTSDSLTKIDGNSSETYDALVRARKAVSDDITEIGSKIATYQLKLADLMKQSDQKVATAAKTDSTEQAQDGAQTETASVEEIQALSDEEIAAAAEAAEEASKRQIAALDKSIAALIEKRTAVTDSFRALLKAYEEQQINEQTVSAFNYRYDTPKLLSGAFIKRVIKTAGPICAVGFMICMILLICSRRKEDRD